MDDEFENVGSKNTRMKGANIDVKEKPGNDISLKQKTKRNVYEP